MADKPDPQSQTPRPSRPNLANLSRETTENDLWALDDEEAPRRSPAADQPKPEAETSATPAPADGRQAGEPTDGEPAEGGPAAEPAPGGPTPAEAPETRPKPGKPERAPAAGFAGLSGRERIALGVFAAIGLAVAIWWIVGQFSGLSTTRLGDDDPPLPAEGEYATVKSAVTGWRAPVREGPDADVARRDVLFIPFVTVELEEGSEGVLRAIFRNDLNEFVGDSVNRRFRNGKFERTGEAGAEFPATSGFEDQADLSGYRFTEDRWTVEIYEAPSADAPGSELNLLFEMPIHPGER
jgi:hypothetical protein